MSNQVTTAFVVEYKNNVEMLLQQRGSVLRDTVSEGRYRGKSGVPVEQIGAVTAKKRTARHADTPLIETPHKRRWVYPSDYEWADLVDNFDRLKLGIQLDGAYSQNGAYALGRGMDDEIIAAYFGTAKTGEDGTVNEPFDTANQQIASGSAGLTVAKLRDAQEILMGNEVDLNHDPMFCVISAKQNANLLGQIEIMSSDFNLKPDIKNGRIMEWAGIQFRHSERLPVSGSERRVPLYVQSGMHLAIWNDIEVKITERSDKSYATQVYAHGSFGATRTDKAKVVDILCAES